MSLLDEYRHHLQSIMEQNKSAQSNLGTGPRRCESKFPLVTMVRPKFAPKSTPSRGPFPGPVRSMMPNGIRIRSAVFHNALDRPTHRPTDRPWENLMTIVRYTPLTRATRPNNTQHCLFHGGFLVPSVRVHGSPFLDERPLRVRPWRFGTS